MRWLLVAFTLRYMLGDLTRTRALADTVADFKWRFYEHEAWAFAVRAGLDLPTAGDVLRRFPARIRPLVEVVPARTPITNAETVLPVLARPAQHRRSAVG